MITFRDTILQSRCRKRLCEASAKEPIEKGLHKIKNVRSCIFFIFCIEFREKRADIGIGYETAPFLSEITIPLLIFVLSDMDF